MKILHLEDNLADAELIHELLREEWPDCAVTLVDNRADFSAQLGTAHDIILSDFSLPSFNGLEALELALKGAPDTPFLFVSGSIGEERAIEAVRNGAHDYVLKDRPKRLTTSIQQALRIATDKRAKKKLETQFLRIQRLETLGMLAAGIAHDLNNVLAPVSMGAPVLRMLVTDPRASKLIDALEASANRGSALVRQILTFARGAGGEHRPLDLAHLADELTRILEQSFPPSITVDSRWPDDLHRVTANPIQMHQVLLNLCVNARDAMPQGGTLTLRARNAAIEPGSAGIAPGDYVRIEIADTGTGIPPDVLERIWEPFFSTKKAEQGTGLGLSTVRGIIESHHGLIQVETALGRGTTFIIHLPVGGSSGPAPVAPCVLCGQLPIGREQA
jgi:signal transduction histidine kinase